MSQLVSHSLYERGKTTSSKHPGSLQQRYVYLMPRQQKMMKIRIITVGRVGDSLLSFLEVFVSAHVSFDKYTFDPGYGRCS